MRSDNKSVNGFSLIECLMYCVCLSLLSLLLFQSLGMSLVKFKQMDGACMQQIEFNTAVEKIRSDITLSQPAAVSWSITSTDVIFPLDQEIYIAWIVKDTNLYRMYGNYNPATGSWHNRHTCLVARNIIHCSLHPTSVSGKIKSVEVFVADATHKKSFTVPLMYGDLA